MTVQTPAWNLEEAVALDLPLLSAWHSHSKALIKGRWFSCICRADFLLVLHGCNLRLLCVDLSAKTRDAQARGSPASHFEMGLSLLPTSVNEMSEKNVICQHLKIFSAAETERFQFRSLYDAYWTKTYEKSDYTDLWMDVHNEIGTWTESTWHSHVSLAQCHVSTELAFLMLWTSVQGPK